MFLEILFLLQDNTGKDLDLGIYKGKVLLVVNVASKWYVLCLATSLGSGLLWD